MEHGEIISIGYKKKVIWYSGEIRIIDEKRDHSILLRNDEAEKLKEILSQNQSLASKEE